MDNLNSVFRKSKSAEKVIIFSETILENAKQGLEIRKTALMPQYSGSR